jgi:hypothetical protein
MQHCDHCEIRVTAVTMLTACVYEAVSTNGIQEMIYIYI